VSAASQQVKPDLASVQPSSRSDRYPGSSEYSQQDLPHAAGKKLATAIKLPRELPSASTSTCGATCGATTRS
jgi:hypothetical protein